MSGAGIDALLRAAAAGPVVRAVIIKTAGSTPREVGAWMLVGAQGSVGTIGGGALEFDVQAAAAEMLRAVDGGAWQRSVRPYHLGPDLDQCCGGAVTILLERFGRAEVASLRALLAGIADNGLGAGVERPLVSGQPVGLVAPGWRAAGIATRDGGDWFGEPLQGAATDLFVYGAGHVGTALVRVLEGLPFQVTWVDGERHEPGVAVVHNENGGVAACRGQDLPGVARTAPAGAFHVVMTHSHALDEAIVKALLQEGRFGYLGLIGSATKRARFRQRLERAGIPAEQIARLHCPVGLAGVAGKSAAILAVSIAADLLLRRQMAIDQGRSVD